MKKVICAEPVLFSFEDDLSHPFLPLLVPIHAGAAAGIVRPEFSLAALQEGHRGAVNQLEVIPIDLALETAAAFGFSVLEVRLAHYGLSPAVAEALPVVHPIPLAGIICHSQTPEALADIIFPRRMTEASATRPIPCGQLDKPGTDLPAAVTLTPPDRRAVDDLSRRLDCHQLPKAHPCNISEAGLYDGGTAAVRHRPSLNTACMQ